VPNGDKEHDSSNLQTVHGRLSKVKCCKKRLVWSLLVLLLSAITRPIALGCPSPPRRAQDWSPPCRRRRWSTHCSTLVSSKRQRSIWDGKRRRKKVLLTSLRFTFLPTPFHNPLFTKIKPLKVSKSNFPIRPNFGEKVIAQTFNPADSLSLSLLRKGGQKDNNNSQRKPYV